MDRYRFACSTFRVQIRGLSNNRVRVIFVCFTVLISNSQLGYTFQSRTSLLSFEFIQRTILRIKSPQNHIRKRALRNTSMNEPVIFSCASLQQVSRIDQLAFNTRVRVLSFLSLFLSNLSSVRAAPMPMLSKCELQRIIMESNQQLSSPFNKVRCWNLFMEKLTWSPPTEIRFPVNKGVLAVLLRADGNCARGERKSACCLGKKRLRLDQSVTLFLTICTITDAKLALTHLRDSRVLLSLLWVRQPFGWMIY